MHKSVVSPTGGARPSGRPVHLLVDATALVPDRITGVGHVLLETLRALDELAGEGRVRVTAFVPASEVAALAKHPFTHIRTRSVPLPRRVYGLMARLPIGLPLDLWLGRGVYFFPNFRNWPLLRSPSITFVHDVCYAVLPDLVPADRRVFLDAHMPMWMRRSNVVATGTASSAHEIETYLGVAADRVVVQPTTVDTAVYHRSPDAAVAAVAARHRLDKYIVFVGSIERRKNLVSLIRAYARGSVRPGHTLLLVGGDGWDNSDIHTAIADARAAGHDVRQSDAYVPDADIPALLSGADALALVSWHEGFGLPALEAIACGTPVIASDIAGIRDATAGHHDAVDFVDPGDVGAIAEAIERAITSRREVDPTGILPWRTAAETLVDTAERLSRR